MDDGQAEPLGEAIFDVADRTPAPLDAAGDAFVAASGHGNAGPIHDLANARSLAPSLADRAQVAGQRVGGAAAVLAGDQRDGLFRELDIRVERLDARIVPLADLAGEDVGVNFPAKLQRPFHVRQIVGEHDGAGGGWNQSGARLRLLDLLVVQGRIAGAKIDGVIQEQLGTLAAAYILVLDGDVGVGLGVNVDPFPIKRRGKGGPGAPQHNPLARGGAGRRYRVLAEGQGNHAGQSEGGGQ